MPKVTDLTAASTPLDGTEVVYVVKGGNSRKTTVADILAAPVTPTSAIQLQAQIAAAGQTTLAQTGIPTWVNRVTCIFSLLSTSGTGDILIQLGNGAYVTTGYVSSYQGFTGNATGPVTSTAGFVIDVDAAANQASGTVTLTRQTGNTWVADGIVRRNGSSVGFTVGEISLGSALDRVRLNTVGGTDTFDAGSFSVSWE